MSSKYTALFHPPRAIFRRWKTDFPLEVDAAKAIVAAVKTAKTTADTRISESLRKLDDPEDHGHTRSRGGGTRSHVFQARLSP